MNYRFLATIAAFTSIISTSIVSTHIVFASNYEKSQTLEGEAQRDELKQQFRHHADETRQQIENIEQAFRALGEEPDDSPSQVTKALDKQAKADIKMADDSIVDTVILSGAEQTEHHEIAVYESLIAQAEQLGEPNVVTLLQQNLEVEQHTLEEVKKAQREVLTAVA